MNRRPVHHRSTSSVPAQLEIVRLEGSCERQTYSSGTVKAKVFFSHCIYAWTRAPVSSFRSRDARY